MATDVELKEGESSGASCTLVNPAFTGEIVLLCHAGFIQPDMTRCEPSPDANNANIVGTHDDWAGKNCTTRQAITASIDAETVTFYPKTNISHDSFEVKACSEVHENYTGDIILNCRDGLIRPDI